MKRALGRGLCAATFLGLALLAVFAAAPAAAQHLQRPVVTSTPASGSTYYPGETIVVQVQPRSSPWVSITSATSPTLKLTVGSSDKTLSGTLQSRRFSYTYYDTDLRETVTRSRETNVLEFRYTVVKGDRDTDGVSVAANALAGGSIGANVGGSSFGGGTWNPNISKNHSQMRAQADHKVDTPAPSWSGVTGPDIIFYAGASVNYRLPQVANAASAHNVSYAVTPALPLAPLFGGYSLSSTGTITGSFLSALSKTTYTLRATDGFNRTADLNFTLEVSADAGIESISITSNPGTDNTYGKVAPFGTNDTITVRVDFTHRLTTILGSRVCLRIQIGSNIRTVCNPSTYTSDSSRWDKLDFSYAVQAGDWDGDGISFPTNPMGAGKDGGLRFRITGVGTDNRVNRSFASMPDDANHKVRGQQTVPSFGSTASPAYSWVKGNAVSQALPAATGGDGGVTYSIEESLPAGLSFAAATRTISGTPTAEQGATNYKLVATDADGDKAELRFSIEILDLLFSISSPSVAEGATGATSTLEYDVTLNRAPGRQVTVNYAAAADPGTATSGTDYSAITGGTLTFAAAQTSQTVDVTVTGDALDEPNETVRIALSNPSGAALGSASTGVGTITDDDPTPTLALALSDPDPGNPDTINESGTGNATTVTASLSGGTSGEAITVTVSATGATAAAGDFSLSSDRTLTIAAGATTSSGAVTVTALDDTTDEPDETVTVGGTVGGGHGLVAAPTGVTLTIADDDARPRSALALSPASISESAGVATVTATLSNPSAAAVTLTVSAAPVAPAMAGDFALSSATTLTIAAGETTSAGTVTVTAVGNATDAPDKSVTVSGTASGTLGAVDPPDATLTIRDDDGAPTVSLVLSSSSVSENGGVATVTAVLSGASSEATTITVSAAAGANAVPGDFTLSAARTLSISAGSTASTGTVTITANDNAVGSPDKQVTVSGTASGGNGVAAPASLTLTLVDDEAAPTTRLTLSPASVGEANGVSTVTATLSGVSSEATTITVSAAAVSSSGADAADFTLSTAKTLTIAAGSTASTGTVTVTANPNTTDSADKQVTVSGTAAGGGGAESPSDATLTITDDDDAPTVTLSLSDSTIDESGSGNVATVSATLSHPSSAATTVTVTPVANVYTVAPGAGATIVIAAGQTANAADTATITAVDDAIDNPADRTATVAGTAANSLAAANSETVSVTGAALTLADDDTAGFALSPSTSASSPLGTTEGGGTATFSVKLASEPTGNVVLGVASSNTAEGTVSPSSLTFNATTWNTAQQVTLTGVDDSPGVSDGARPYTVTLTVNETSTEDPTYDGLSAVTVHAVNADDEHGLVVGSVTGQATEAGGQATFTVKLATEPTGDVTVAVTSQDASEGTVSPSSLTFTTTTWNTTQTVTVTGVDDAIDEGTVTWEVRLDPSSSDDTNYNSLSNVDVSVTTTDDDAAPTVSIDSPSVAEGTGATGGTLRFTVRLSAASGRQVTVDYADAGTGTATSGADYTALTAGTLTFTAGTTTQTIDVAVTGDTADEPAETVVVTLSGPVNATLAAGATTGTGTVTDDDDAPTVSIDSPSVMEGTGATGGTLRFTVRLSAASGRQVTVAYADAGTGTATSGADYTAITAGTLTFAIGTTSQTLDVAVTGDAADEPAETVVVTLSDPVNATLAADAATGTGTVTDDDAVPTVSIDSPSVTEGTGATGGTLRFTVRLSAASGRQVTVAYADAGTGTATSGTDYTALTAGTLTFTAGTTTQTIDVTVTGDALHEANETVEVTLSTPTNAALSAAATGTGTVTDDDAIPTVSINSPSVAEGTGATGGTLTFTVTLSAASGRSVTVAYARTGGTATSGTDYTALTAGTLTFTAGTTTQTIDVTVTGDAADEPDETVEVTLSGPTNATLDTGTGTGTITDDDGAPTVSIDSPSVTEGTGRRAEPCASRSA